MNLVKELRIRAGLQQKEIAIVAGVSRPTVSEWEHQKKDPSGERLKRLADYFHVDPSVILGYKIPALSENTEEREAWKIRQQIREDPELRILFDAAKGATPEHIRAAVAMLKALKGEL